MVIRRALDGGLEAAEEQAPDDLVDSPSTSNSTPRPWPVSSWMEPLATTRPSRRITAASQIRSTSSSRCDDDDVDAELGADAADEGEHVVALHRVEAVGGLVEQHQVGVVGDGLGQLHPLALPGRHRADRPEPLLAEPDRPEGVARAVGGVAPRQPVHLGEVAHEVVGPRVGRQAVVLGCVPDPRPHPRPGGGRVEAEHLRRSAVGGGAEPSMSPRNVVLPAPLAPSSPVSPLATVKVAPSTAVVRPKRRVSAVPSTTVVAVAECSPMGWRA